MYEIEITPEQLKNFPASVPMNIREAILLTVHGLKRIRGEAAKKAEAAEEKPQETQEPAPVEVIVLPQPKRRGRPSAKVIYAKKS